MRHRLNHLPVPSDRAMRVLKWVVIAAVVVFLLWLLVGMARLGQTAEDNAQALKTAQAERAELDRRVDEQGVTIDKQDDAISTANRRLKGAGKPPVTVADQPAAVPKVDGQPVLTSDDVLTLIEAEVKTQHPDLTTAQKRALTDAAAIKAAARIPDPKDGKDGTDGPTLEDLRPIIRAEVAKIPVPADGVDGQDGTTPTAEDVAAALTALCGGSCKGEKGDTGEPGVQGAPGADSTVPGPAGKDGRGITTVTCEADGTWTFTWSDDTTSTVAGPCRAVEPSPEPTPTTSEPAPTTTTGATP